MQTVQIPALDENYKTQIEKVKDLILAEVNVKELEFANEKNNHIVKNLKLNFRTLGKKCGQNMKAMQEFAVKNSSEIISSIEKNGTMNVSLNGTEI